jgi:hypothetical protein
MGVRLGLCRRGRACRSRREDSAAVGAPATAGSAAAEAAVASRAWSVRARIASAGVVAAAVAAVIGSCPPIGSQGHANDVFESGFVIVWSSPSMVPSAVCGLPCRREPHAAPRGRCRDSSATARASATGVPAREDFPLPAHALPPYLSGAGLSVPRSSRSSCSRAGGIAVPARVLLPSRGHRSARVVLPARTKVMRVRGVSRCLA